VRLIHLTLRNYRNYARLDLDPSPGLNIFLGANGQGKTNLLESVSLLALSSSPRTRRESELIGPAGSEARILSEVVRLDRQYELRLSVSAPTEYGGKVRKRIEVDGQSRRTVDLPGIFRICLFWPDDLQLVKGGPEHRRRLLNQMLVQVEPGYATVLARYARTLEQRNSLLKQVAAGEHPPASLDLWDEEMARLGLLLAGARREAVLAIQPPAAAEHSRISGGEELELEYLGPPEDLLAALREARPDDLRHRSSTVGPHRDDVVIRIDSREARSFASQGQQRSAVVSIKLGEAAVVASRTGEVPVLLLDDVLSELDSTRRAALLERLVSAGQVIITSVEADLFQPAVLRNSALRTIRGGEVVSGG
jgi:DNA replication and repair protein RecF